MARDLSVLLFLISFSTLWSLVLGSDCAPQQPLNSSCLGADIPNPIQFHFNGDMCELNNPSICMPIATPVTYGTANDIPGYEGTAKSYVSVQSMAYWYYDDT